MPLHCKIDHDSNTQILVWHITESLASLLHELPLNPTSLLRLEKMKSEQHKRGFLSIRKLLQNAGYQDHDLWYDASGKPFLIDGTHISISHSFEFATIITSNREVGVDIELRREKITAVAQKFSRYEFDYLNPDHTTDYIKKLTVIWGAKEAVFKIVNQEGINFKRFYP